MQVLVNCEIDNEGDMFDNKWICLLSVVAILSNAYTTFSRPGHKILLKFQVQGQAAIYIFKTRTKYFAA